MQTNGSTGTPKTLSASSLIGNDVKNAAGEDLGKIEEIMLDLDFGRISYAVVSFGGFLGMGNKLFAVPFDSLGLDTDNHCCTLNVAKDRLEQAPGFDKDDWPDFADRNWGRDVHSFYDTQVYW